MPEPNYSKLYYDVGGVFTPGAPVNERQLFSGRIDQSRKILETISQRGYHVILYGERGVGKTSLSNVLAELLSENSSGDKFLFPRVNCDASDSFSSLWRKQLQDIITTESRPGIGFDAENIEVNKHIVDGLPDIITPDDVRRTLDQLSKGVVLVPIFDEFDRVRDDKIPTLMADTVKTLSDYSIDATIVLIGVAESVDDLIKEHQSIERALVQVPMPRMSNNEIGAIVRGGLQRLGMIIQPAAQGQIIRLSQGLPYITHLLALHSARTAIQGKRLEITSADVTAGIARAIDQWQQSIKTAYEAAIRSHQPAHIYKEVLLACALAEADDRGYFSASAVREPLRVITDREYDIPNFARHLKELSESGRGDMLSRVGESRRFRYRFNSPLMRPFIIMKGLSIGLITNEKMRIVAGDSSH